MKIEYQPRATAAPPDGAGRGFGRAVVLAVLALSLVQLLCCHLNGDAPLRRDFGRSTDDARNAASAARLLLPLVRLAGGRNLQLHYAPTTDTSYETGNIHCGLYYGLNYALYPARAIVGDGRSIINDGDTLRAADVVPADRLLRAHGVAAVLTVQADRSSIRTAVRPLLPTSRP
jgi:hypothetical protein